MDAQVDGVDNKYNLDPVSSAPVLVLDVPALDCFE